MELEPVCARLLAQSRTEEDLAELRGCIEELRAVVLAGVDEVPDPYAWAQLTFRFHELLMQRAGNKTLAVQGAVLQDIVATHLNVTVARSFGDPSTRHRFLRTIASYTKLVELVEGRDSEGAEKHWRHHMEVAAKSLLRGDLKSKPVVDLFS
jgi:GntR family transcriptional repressor for pyruvate dehydrogenase complex